MIIDWDADGRTDLLQPDGVRRTPVLPFDRQLARALPAGRHQRGHHPGVADDARRHRRLVPGPRSTRHRASGCTSTITCRPTCSSRRPTATACSRRSSTRRWRIRVVHKVSAARRVPGARPRASRLRGLEDAARRQPWPGGGDLRLRGREAARRRVAASSASRAGRSRRATTRWCESRSSTRTRLPTSASARRRASRCSSAPAFRSRAPATRWGQHSYGSGYESRRFAYPASVMLERYELDGVRVSSTTTSNYVRHVRHAGAAVGGDDRAREGPQPVGAAHAGHDPRRRRQRHDQLVPRSSGGDPGQSVSTACRAAPR